MAKKTPVKCTPKEEIFCQEFIISLNGSDAARKAKYGNAAYDAWRLLKRPRVIKRIAELRKEREIRTHITPDRVLQEYAVIAFSDLADYIEIEDGGGIIAKKFDDIGDLKSRALKKIKEDRAIKENKDDSVTMYDKITFELHDKIKALDFLAKHLGMEGGIDKLDINLPEIGKLMTQAHINYLKNKEKKEKD